MFAIMVLFIAMTLRPRRVVLALHIYRKFTNENNQGNRRTLNDDRIIYTNQKIISKMDMNSVGSLDKPIARIYYKTAAKIQIIINSIFKNHNLIILWHAICWFSSSTNFTNILHNCRQNTNYHKINFPNP